MISNLMLVLGVGALSAALRSLHHPVLHRLGTLGIFVTSFLAGWLFTDSILVGLLFASSWIFLPWLEILTRVRRMRLPIERRLEPRKPPNRATFPNLNELSDEIEAESFEQIDDAGWEHGDQSQFYRLFYQPQSCTEAAICLVEQNDLAFYYLSVTSRTRDGVAHVTWSYPFSYSLRIMPRLKVRRVTGDLSFSELLAEHRHALDHARIGSGDLVHRDPDAIVPGIQNDLREQVTFNLDRGLLKRDGEHFIRYSVRGMFFLWFQFLRDLVRLS
jgi:hypothetical protein